jgi:hypothetical protein
MATNVVNPNQLKLFMTGVEWQESVTHSTDGPISTVWKDKSGEARVSAEDHSYRGAPHGAGVYHSIREHGYRHDPSSPPTIVLEDAPNGKSVRKVQSEGHHRIAAAADLEREGNRTSYIPTNYVDNTAAGRRNRYQP